MESNIMEIKFKRRISMIIMAVGAVMLLVGLFYMVPSDQLTTYESLSKYDSYSYVESYINGDAYNYIIAGSLVGGRIAGTLALKGGLISVGGLIICMGFINFRPHFASEQLKKEESDIPIDEGGIDLRKYENKPKEETENSN